ncbi:hypothetical protein ACSLBF_20615 (plasmid) [Pseudoalteromonas sp. T1lg65]|uniref:hypothetical protein n=1 Tax=Pseudoalteromonas sp. T1lg65 TaxID=2077101 RepID=UPI003F791AD0
MKLTLNKKSIKVLNKTNGQLPFAQTPQVAGGRIASLVNECNTALLCPQTIPCNSALDICPTMMVKCLP